MSTNSSTEIVQPERPLFDEARVAIAGFLARYSGPTRVSYTSDRRSWFSWCETCGLVSVAVKKSPRVATSKSPLVAM